MPHVYVNAPPLKDLNKKRVLVKELTDVVEKVYKQPREFIVVVIREDDPSNVSAGGVLVIDKK